MAQSSRDIFKMLDMLNEGKQKKPVGYNVLLDTAASFVVDGTQDAPVIINNIITLTSGIVAKVGKNKYSITPYANNNDVTFQIDDKSYQGAQFIVDDNKVYINEQLASPMVSKANADIDKFPIANQPVADPQKFTNVTDMSGFIIGGIVKNFHYQLSKNQKAVVDNPNVEITHIDKRIKIKSGIVYKLDRDRYQIEPLPNNKVVIAEVDKKCYEGAIIEIKNDNVFISAILAEPLKISIFEKLADANKNNDDSIAKNTSANVRQTGNQSKNGPELEKSSCRLS